MSTHMGPCDVADTCVFNRGCFNYINCQEFEEEEGTMVRVSKERQQARRLMAYLNVTYVHALRLLREGKYKVDDDGNVTKIG